FIFNKNGDILVETDKEDNVVSRFTRGYEIVAADISETESDISEISKSPTNHNLSICYYSADEQGSTDFITDADGNVKNEYWYDAFGNVLDSREDVHNRITYTGQQFDGVTNQYYLRARFYNPVIGRFTQEDVYRGDGLNLYAYCGNNPIGYFDPSGYNSKQCEQKGQIQAKAKNDIKEYDIVNYSKKTCGIENHHGVLDVWATNNIPGYKSRASKSTTIALSKKQHAKTKEVYRNWLFEKTGKKVGGKIDWKNISPKGIQSLTEKMFDAAKVPHLARKDYYREFNKYIYNLE
uniref:RHS repeat-associated core domain-containing protein n=1 Tax=Clostridium butyricum TaxID=1492 RepID=UPI00374F1450